MRALVTGAAGFVGRHLTAHLKEEGHDVFGLVHPSEESDGPSGIHVTAADLLDDVALAKAVHDVGPEVIFHLAAFSNPESSLRYARLTFETNFLGTQNLLEAAKDTGHNPRILLIGSCQQYGQVAESEQPIGEDRPQRPLTPYAVSKASQELLGQRYFLSEGSAVFWTRSFNHTGPGQADSYVCSSFARQVAEIEALGREPEIRVGNLTARRDFTDVRDVARAYTAIIERGEPGRAYNVCRGDAVAIQEILDVLVSLATVPVEVKVDPERYHALDAPLIVGDAARLTDEIGFAPRYLLRETLEDLLNDWRQRLAVEKKEMEEPKETS
ncbi:MAG: NAD-dependent epimerase/dehydratase family protein [Acidobacteria bacterium]|nr:MAG: NAD-dependent epimerase/dehydratase family protein [Acidobacteriota bacterium]